jgi:hypothetical protein
MIGARGPRVDGEHAQPAAAAERIRGRGPLRPGVPGAERGGHPDRQPGAAGQQRRRGDRGDAGGPLDPAAARRGLRGSAWPADAGGAGPAHPGHRSGEHVCAGGPAGPAGGAADLRQRGDRAHQPQPAGSGDCPGGGRHRRLCQGAAQGGVGPGWHRDRRGPGAAGVHQRTANRRRPVGAGRWGCPAVPHQPAGHPFRGPDHPGTEPAGTGGGLAPATPQPRQPGAHLAAVAAPQRQLPQPAAPGAPHGGAGAGGAGDRHQPAQGNDHPGAERRPGGDPHRLGPEPAPDPGDGAGEPARPAHPQAGGGGAELHQQPPADPFSSAGAAQPGGCGGSTVGTQSARFGSATGAPGTDAPGTDAAACSRHTRAPSVA